MLEPLQPRFTQGNVLFPKPPAAAACLPAITHFKICHSHTWRALLLTYNVEKAVGMILVSSLPLQLSWFKGNRPS